MSEIKQNSTNFSNKVALSDEYFVKRENTGVKWEWIYDFKFSDMLKFLENGKTFPPSVNNIPEFLQKKPEEEKRD